MMAATDTQIPIDAFGVGPKRYKLLWTLRLFATDWRDGLWVRIHLRRLTMQQAIATVQIHGELASVVMVERGPKGGWSGAKFVTIKECNILFSKRDHPRREYYAIQLRMGRATKTKGELEWLEMA